MFPTEKRRDIPSGRWPSRACRYANVRAAAMAVGRWVGRAKTYRTGPRGGALSCAAPQLTSPPSSLHGLAVQRVAKRRDRAGGIHPCIHTTSVVYRWRTASVRMRASACVCGRTKSGLFRWSYMSKSMMVGGWVDGGKDKKITQERYEGQTGANRHRGDKQ
jgi:hypothetical protein